ncbi:MAG: tetratricopeptide repeat protein [Anaerolineae bacterium]|jgi:tetratricopeptide (TPR) repeat protein|nr:tetratricopeptide repeat protein [Anaerolineae bacterium]
MGIETTVFISYRRANHYIARSVYQDLRGQGYDVFLDYQNVDSGSFERIILNQIAARAHFILILTPSALERCLNPDDWVRREIEHAIVMQRNIVPLLFEGFAFEQARPFLVGQLTLLPNYNGINVPPDFFEEAMERLRKRFLSKPLEVILHPAPAQDRHEVDERLAEMAQQPAPTPQQLNAESHYERGCQCYMNRQYEQALHHFNAALRLNPAYIHAHYNRGVVHHDLNDLVQAIQDYSKALSLIQSTLKAPASSGKMSPADWQAYLEQEIARREMRGWQHEIYYQRALAYVGLDKPQEALNDFSAVLRLQPEHFEARGQRAELLMALRRYGEAVTDYETILQFQPDHSTATARLMEARKLKAKHTGLLGGRLK